MDHYDWQLDYKDRKHEQRKVEPEDQPTSHYWVEPTDEQTEAFDAGYDEYLDALLKGDAPC